MKNELLKWIEEMDERKLKLVYYFILGMRR